MMSERVEFDADRMAYGGAEEFWSDVEEVAPGVDEITFRYADHSFASFYDTHLDRLEALGFGFRYAGLGAEGRCLFITVRRGDDDG